jgi:hypothetical protein
MNGNKMLVPKNPKQGDVLVITNADGSVSYYNYDPDNANANSAGYVGSGLEGTNSGVTVSSKREKKEDSITEGAGAMFGFFSLSSDVAEHMGGFDKAMKIFNEGSFQMLYKGQLKTYSINFNGNQFVDADLVKLNKLSFGIKATGNIAFFKALKIAGPLANISGGLVALWDMKKNGINGENSMDLIMSGVAFIPAVGWITSGGYFLIKFIIAPGKLSPEEQGERQKFIEKNHDEILKMNQLIYQNKFYP